MADEIKDMNQGSVYEPVPNKNEKIKLDREELQELFGMNADLDALEESGVSQKEVLARTVLKAVQGVNEDNMPKACLSLSLMNYFSDAKRFGNIAEQALYKPVVEINKRGDFCLIVLKFPNDRDVSLRTLVSHLNKYGDMENQLTSQSKNIPFASLTIVPVDALGVLYMTAVNPIMWVAQPDAPKTLGDISTSKELKNLHILFPLENLEFYQSDEIDMTDIIAAAQRQEDATQEYYNQLAEKEWEERLGGDDDEDEES